MAYLNFFRLRDESVRLQHWIPCLLAFVLAGCGSNRGPQFSARDDAKGLIDDARSTLNDTLVEGFGTPNDLVAWTALPLDFGSFSGTVEAIGSTPGSAQVELKPTENSTLATESRLKNLEGAAIVVPGHKGVLRVGSYEIREVNSETIHQIQIIDENGENATVDLTKKNSFRVVADSEELKAKGLSIDSVIDAVAEKYEVVGGEDGGPLTVSAKGDAIPTRSDLDSLAVPLGKDDQTVGLGTLAEIKVAYVDIMVVGAGLQHGRDLYLRHCMHCHGVSGDANGPTAKYLNPLPRDYRDGITKFTSTKRGMSPNRLDLYRIVKLGVPSTYMPSFMLLPDDDVRSLVEYVRFLAMRGQIETQVLSALKGDFAIEDKDNSETLAAKKAAFVTYLKEDFLDMLTESTEIVTDGWASADDPDNVVMPTVARPVLAVGSDELKKSLEAGRKLFLDAKNKCSACHGEKGRGDGASTEDHVMVDGVPAKEPGYFDQWGNRVTPRNLTQGFFRGGRRPIDIYRRIRVGIKGTPMPAAPPELKDPDVWHLVNYVLSIPFEDK
jgi:mono/diheme cytochrome c family protein